MFPMNDNTSAIFVIPNVCSLYKKAPISTLHFGVLISPNIIPGSELSTFFSRCRRGSLQYPETCLLILEEIRRKC